MNFLYFFDLLDFDKNGAVCATERVDLAHARSNFLYLISKYNQMFLKDENLPIPSFFKDDLQEVLQNVEQGGDYEKAKKQVLKSCLPKVQAYSNTNERAFVSALAEKLSLKDMDFAEKMKNATNNLQLAYIITHISGSKFESIWKAMASEGWQEDKQIKSKLYKDVILYNSLVSTAEKVKDSNELFKFEAELG